MNPNNLAMYQDENQIISEKIRVGIFPVILALCPILQHYQGVFLDVSSELLILCVPYILLRLVMRRKLRVKATILLILYALYVSVIHGVSIQVLGRELILVLIFIGIENDCMDIDGLIKAMEFIARLATFVIIIQYISYYLFSKHLQIVPTGLFVDSAEQWKKLAETGRISVTGSLMSFYRPSAFFLEPSHFTIYSIPSIITLALRPDATKKDIRKALFISFGVILTTSGMGLFSVVLIWLLHSIFKREPDDRVKFVRLRSILNPKTLFFIILFAIVFVGLYLSVGIFRSTVNRIFISDVGNNAIQGRTSTGLRAIRKMNASNFLTGVGSLYSLSDWNMSGFFYTLFKYGLIGCLLIYSWYLRSLRKLPRELFWLDIMIIILSFFTVHTYAAFYRLVFISIILDGQKVTYQDTSDLSTQPSISEEKLTDA